MIWTIETYISATGATPVLRWLSGLPDDAQAAIDDRLLMMEAMQKWPEKWASAYQGRKGIVELRIPHNRIQYRPLGAYSPHRRRSFVILAGAIERGDKIPAADLDRAERHLAELTKNPKCAKSYEY